jgi:hypothetical protein
MEALTLIQHHVEFLVLKHKVTTDDPTNHASSKPYSFSFVSLMPTTIDHSIHNFLPGCLHHCYNSDANFDSVGFAVGIVVVASRDHAKFTAGLLHIIAVATNHTTTNHFATDPRFIVQMHY